MVYLYFFKSLKPILLNPFYKNKEIGDLNSEREITVFSGNTLTTEDNEYINRAAFQEIDASVNLWIQEKRYFIRLFASTGAFFIMYFFLSLVIRDPIPLLDEAVGSIIFAIITWRFFAKRDTKAAVAHKKKLEIKRGVNEAKFKDLNLIQIIETYLYELNSLDTLDIADALTLVEGKVKPIEIGEDDKLHLEQVIELLRKKLVSTPKLKRFYKKITKVREKNKSDEVLSSKLIEYGKVDKFSLTLLTLLVALEKK